MVINLTVKVLLVMELGEGCEVSCPYVTNKIRICSCGKMKFADVNKNNVQINILPDEFIHSGRIGLKKRIYIR